MEPGSQQRLGFTPLRRGGWQRRHACMAVIESAKRRRAGRAACAGGSGAVQFRKGSACGGSPSRMEAKGTVGERSPRLSGYGGWGDGPKKPGGCGGAVAGTRTDVGKQSTAWVLRRQQESREWVESGGAASDRHCVVGHKTTDTTPHWCVGGMGRGQEETKVGMVHMQRAATNARRPRRGVGVETSKPVVRARKKQQGLITEETRGRAEWHEQSAAVAVL